MKCVAFTLTQDPVAFMVGYASVGDACCHMNYVKVFGGQ